MLTIDDQPRHILSITDGVTVRFDFEDMEGVCPVEIVRIGVAIFMEDDEIGREVSLVEDPALKLLCAVDVVGLTDSGTGHAELGTNVENSVCHLRQGLVERRLPLARAVTVFEVLLVVFSEIGVSFNRIYNRLPLGVPVFGDVEHTLHEDPEVNKNSALEVLVNVIFIIVAVVAFDPVCVTFLPLSDGRPTGERCDFWRRADRVAIAFRSLGLELIRRREGWVNLVRLGRW